MIKELLYLAKPAGCDAQVLSFYPAGPSQQVVFGSTCYKFNAWLNLASTPLAPSALFKFGSLVRRFDLLHYHFPYPYADFLHYLHRPAQPYVITYHTDIIKQKRLLKLYQPLQRWFLAGAAKIVATSPNYVASSKVLADYAAKVQVIPIGLADQYSVDPLEVARLKKLYKDFVLFVGVFRYYKGLKYLISAMRGLPQNLVLVGNGPYLSKLKIAAAGAPNIHFLGAVNDAQKFNLLQASSLVAMPSHLRSEALGILLLEGARQSKALLSCEIGTGTSFANLHDYSGLVVEPANSSQLRQAISKLFAEPSLRHKYAQQARSRYERLFGAQKMADSYHQLYKQVLAEAKK